MGAPKESVFVRSGLPRLELRRLSRRYPGQTANENVDLSVRPGEIHAVLGENGSGKSTLMRCVYGVEKPDAGTILWNGAEVALRDANHARELGMALVFQHFSLIEALSVMDNVRLYLGTGRLGQLKPASIAQQLERLALELDLPVDPSALVGDLSMGEQQRVEILRCLLLSPQLLMLDEPTSSLTPAETHRLFSALRQLAKRGCSILFVTHRLSEVRELCDVATILRRGRVVSRCNPREKSEDELAELIVGTAASVPMVKRSSTTGVPQLVLESVRTSSSEREEPLARAIDLSVRGGEIIGIAGIAGNGQGRLSDLITGEQKPASGRIWLDAHDVTGWSPRKRRQRGLHVIPAERTYRGAVPSLDLVDNLLLTEYDHYTDRHLGPCAPLNRSAALNDSATVMREQDVRASDPSVAAGKLSGGNLQKFLVGRALRFRPRVLICHNPTWGVDTLAAGSIHRQLMLAREAGVAILLISADLDEIYRLADRIAVIHRGVLSEPRSPERLPRTQLGLLMTGAQAE